MECLKLFNRRRFISFCLALVLAAGAFAQNVSAVKSSETTVDSLVMGLEAYRNQDWANAALLLKQSVSSGQGNTDNVWYMMIMSQIMAGYYESAINDCNTFERLFPGSEMKQSLLYQKGRVLHLLGKNGEASGILTNFCMENRDSPLYVTALFWLAECFYDECDFASAENIYSMIVAEYPEDYRSVDSNLRLEEIARGDRERKLLYLLKTTGEEYLSLKESYDSLLKSSKTDFTEEDLDFMLELVNLAKDKKLGLDESKLNRLNKKLNSMGVSKD